jgi:hypothetical protein
MQNMLECKSCRVIIDIEYVNPDDDGFWICAICEEENEIEIDENGSCMRLVSEEDEE